MPQSLRDITNKARETLDFARPATAIVLLVLTGLTEGEIAMIEGGLLMENASLHAIADRLGIDRQTVVDVYNRYIVKDAIGRELIYREKMELYLQSTVKHGLIERSLISFSSHDATNFVLYDCIFTWDPSVPCLTLMRIEDDDLAVLCEGSLIYKGWGFSSSVDLLNTACRHKWHKWESLWRYF